MKYAQIADGQTKTYVLVFAVDDEAITEITAFAKRENVTAARLTGLGGSASECHFLLYGDNATNLATEKNAQSLIK